MVQLTVTEDQVRWFRLARAHLLEGAVTPRAAAAAQLGIQAQQEGPALIGLSRRLAARPTTADLAADLPAQGLVHTWAHRDTLHLLDAAAHWRDIAAARLLWPDIGRSGGMPTDEALAAGLAAVQTAPGPVGRTDLYAAMPAAYVAGLTDSAARARMAPLHFAAHRVLWKLAQRGDVCPAGKRGREGLFTDRSRLFPDLPWPATEPGAAAHRLIAGFLAAFGPATPADIAHFFGCKVGDIKPLLAGMNPAPVPVACGGRKGLLIGAADAPVLQAQTPAADHLVMLPPWDACLIAHKDKSWLVDDALRGHVFRPGLYVAATVLHDGRVAATWRHAIKRGILEITLEPLPEAPHDLVGRLEPEGTDLARRLGATEVSWKTAS